MSIYAELRHLELVDFPRCNYAKASEIVAPLRNALNSARMLPEQAMVDLKAVLKTALDHIESAEGGPAEQPAPASTDTEDADSPVDPLDELLGPAE